MNRVCVNKYACKAAFNVWYVIQPKASGLCSAVTYLILIGLFITNLAARDKRRRATSLKALRENFPTLLSISVPEDVNEIVIGPLASGVSSAITKRSSRRDEDLDCNVSNCAISDEVQGRIAALAKAAENYAHDVEAASLQSKLVEYLSSVHFYHS